MGDAVLGFGPFNLAGSPRRLSFEGQVVPLGPLSLEVLAVLAERQGDLVERAYLVARIDSESPIDEAGILERVAAINPVLEARVPTGCYIAHFPNEGFVLVVPDADEGRRPLRLPSRPTSIIGRAEAIARMVAQAQEATFVDGVCFVDLSTLTDSGLSSAR